MERAVKSQTERARARPAAKQEISTTPDRAHPSPVATGAGPHRFNPIHDSPRMVAQRQLIEGMHDSPRMQMRRSAFSAVGERLERAGGATSQTPVQRKKIGLWLAGFEQNDKDKIKNLIGTATDTQQVSDENLDAIIEIYKQEDANRVGRIEWNEERERRIKARKATDLGAKLKDLLGDAWNGAAATITALVGQATNYNMLPVGSLVELYQVLNPIASAKDECKAIVSALDDAIKREPAGDVAAKVKAEKEKATDLKQQGLAALARRFGPNFVEAIDGWKAYMLKQQRTAFEVLYRANQMTARFIAPDSSARGGTFKAMVSPPTGGDLTTGNRDMTLDRDVSSIKKRTDPATWQGQAVANVKRDQGLYELSATLLKGKGNDGGIYKQLKHYTDATALFMPAADIEDHQILAALMDDPRADMVVKEVGAVMTRILRAQASDMGAKYVDHAPDSDTGDIHYGRTGRVVRYEGVPGIMATPYELEARNTNALQYGKIVEGAASIVNEIVIEYRKGREALFPMYAKWDGAASEWYVVNADGQRTGQKIDDTTGVVT